MLIKLEQEIIRRGGGGGGEVGRERGHTTSQSQPFLEESNGPVCLFSQL